MRLLTDQELLNVSAGLCPFCFIPPLILLASSSTAAVNYFSGQLYVYVTGGILLGLSAAASVGLIDIHQILKSEPKPEPKPEP